MFHEGLVGGEVQRRLAPSEIERNPVGLSVV
jgi:hypothetical protein